MNAPTVQAILKHFGLFVWILHPLSRVSLAQGLDSKAKAVKGRLKSDGQTLAQ